MRGWTVLPDYVSVNLHEPEAEDVVALMQARGIGVEAGLWTRADAVRFARLAAAALQPPGAGRDDRRGPGGRRGRGGGDPRHAPQRRGHCPILLHGQGGSVWPMVELAAGRGLATRVGFEDGQDLPGGALAASNAALVAAAARLLG